jgi:hypothetical protein
MSDFSWSLRAPLTSSAVCELFPMFSQVAGLCVLEHQFKQGHTAVLHDFIVIDGADIDEGKITGIEFSCCARAGKQLRPVQRVGPGAATSV